MNRRDDGQPPGGGRKQRAVTPQQPDATPPAPAAAHWNGSMATEAMARRRVAVMADLFPVVATVMRQLDQNSAALEERVFEVLAQLLESLVGQEITKDSENLKQSAARSAVVSCRSEFAVLWNVEPERFQWSDLNSETQLELIEFLRAQSEPQGNSELQQTASGRGGRLLRRFMALLGAEDRLLLGLIEVEDWDPGWVAAACELAEAELWQRVNRARERLLLVLRQALAPWLAGALAKSPKCKSQDSRQWHLGVLRAMGMIENRIGEPVTLGDLALVAGLSPFYFTRLFKQTTGITPHEYVVGRRVARSRQLLEQGELSFAAIAVESGFCDQSHFCQHFKKWQGMTPGKFAGGRNSRYRGSKLAITEN